MHLYQQFHIVAYRLADGFHLRDGQPFGLDGDEQAPMLEGVAFERGDSLIDETHRGLDG